MQTHRAQGAVCNTPVPFTQSGATLRIAGGELSRLLALNSLCCFAPLAEHCPADWAQGFSINFQGLTQRVPKELAEILTLYIPVTPQGQNQEVFWSKCSVCSSLL